ncbi:transcriptional regulator, LacI family [Actinopolyspora mzabensis]|uniref:Transcriptional regulator, LacI family n=1 Tax=Actinopolyspora mzabensis TaxID=995066 RepID=A0A1G9EN21_ACTMZ|nr:LacI family DNA-binding transcriptional regulator [Actinopolyspora mzabensis]SDK77405.1 transcriptional regulator, LacI family [Actinopolyspora mzabensis]
MATIEEVARAAGVSTATVSRALRQQPGVSERTRQRVRTVAEEMNYSISRSASGLATGRTRRVGVLVPFVSRWFFGQVLAGAEEVLRSAGYDLMLYVVGDEEGRERFFRELPLRRSVDAVLVLTLSLSTEESDRLRELDVPLGFVGGRMDGFNSVWIDDHGGGMLAVRHLLNQGHTDIAMIHGGAPDALNLPAPHERCTAFRDAMAEHEIPVRESWLGTGDFSVSGGRRAMNRILADELRPTAVFAMSDEMAFGAMHALRNHKIHVPGEIAIVGFDGHEMSECSGLSTVVQPVRQEGGTAAKLLLEQLEQGSTETRDVVLPTELVVRSSTTGDDSM